MPSNSFRRRILLSSTGYDPYAVLFFNRVAANGFYMSDIQKRKYNELFVVINAAGYSAEIDRLHIYCSYNQTLALTSLFNNYTAAPLGNPAFSALSGYALVATSQCVNSTYNPAAAGLASSLDSNCMFCRIDGITTMTQRSIQGVQMSPSFNAILTGYKLATGDITFYDNTSTGTNGTILTLGDVFFGVKRLSSTMARAYAGVNMISIASTSVAIPNGVVYDGALNSDNTVFNGVGQGVLKYAANGSNVVGVRTLGNIIDAWLLTI